MYTDGSRSYFISCINWLFGIQLMEKGNIAVDVLINIAGKYELWHNHKLVTTQTTLEKLFKVGAKYFKGQGA